MDSSDSSTPHKPTLSSGHVKLGEPCVIPGNLMRRVDLGRYDRSAPPPTFSVAWAEADAAEVVTHFDIRVDHKDGTYSLVRAFQNYGDVDQRVRVRRTSAM
jgi:hypothetical protein